MCISMAVCEYLICLGAIVLCASHNIQPQLLLASYPSAGRVHFDATISYNQSSEESIKINYLHRLSFDPDATLQNDYGIMVSELYGFPPFTIEDAKKFKIALKRETSLAYKLSYRADTFEEDVDEIKKIFESHQGSLSEATAEVRDYVQKLDKAKLEKFYYYLTTPTEPISESISNITE